MDMAELRIKALPMVLQYFGRDPKAKKIRCLNPEHNDSNPSMQINLDTGRVYCYSCKKSKKSWDSIDLIQMIENLDWHESIKKAADLAGLHLPDTNISIHANEKTMQKYTQKIYEIIIKLGQQDKIKAASKLAEYLGREGQDVEKICDQENIGYIDCDADNFILFIREELGITDKKIANEIFYYAGLYTQKYEIEECIFLYTRNRLIFPLIEDGIITNISARTMNNVKPKFLLLSRNPPTMIWGGDNIEIADPSLPVILVEGEGDRLAILVARHPVIPICIRGTASGNNEKFINKLSKINATRNVVWLIDNDLNRVGYRSAINCGTSCPGVKIAQIDPKRGDDAKDWIMRGCSKEEFMEVIDNAKFPRELEPDIPIKFLPMPKGYRISDKGVEVEKSIKGGQFWETMCNQPIWLDKIGMSKTEKYYLVVSFMDPMSRRKEATMSAGDVNNLMKLKEYATLGMAITFSNAKDMSDYLSASFREIGHKLQRIDIAEQSGWRGTSQKPFPFVFGGETIGKTGSVPYIPSASINMSVASGLRTGGSFDEWKITARKIWACGSVARFCLMLPFAGPLLHPLLGSSFLTYVWGGKGRTSTTGKTTLALFALSVWGETDSLKQSLSATDIGITEACAQLSDLFIVLDERQSASSKQDICKLVYMVALGKGKLQGAAGGGTRDQKTWRIAGIATGEEPLARKLDGEFVRIIDIHATNLWGQCEGTHREFARSVERCYKRNYGYAGRQYLESLIDKFQSKSDRQRMEERILIIEKELVDMTPDNPMVQRLASNFSIIALAGEIVAEEILEVPFDSALGAIKEIYMQYGKTWEIADLGKRAIRATSEWMVRYSMRFERRLSDYSQRFGLANDEEDYEKPYVYLLGSAWEKEMYNCGIDGRTAKMIWRDRGWLEHDSSDTHHSRTTKICFLDGKAVRMIALKKEVINKILEEG